MKSNLILILAIILVLGIISDSNQKRVHHNKKYGSREPEPEAKKEEAEKTDETKAAEGTTDEAAKTAEKPKGQTSEARKSLQDLNAIIKQIQAKHPAEKTDETSDKKGDVKDMQLFLDQKINPETAQKHLELSGNKLCQLKQGYMTQIVKQEEIKGKKIASGRHVFAVLNQKTISIFEAVHVNSLLASLELSDIDEPKLTLKKLNCFELQNKNKKEKGFQLCAKNINEMNEWMYDIKNMLTCNPNAKPVIIQDGVEVETTEEEANSDLKMKIIQKKHSIKDKLTQQQEADALAQAKSAEFAKIQALKDEQQKKIIEAQMQKAMEAMKRKRASEEKRRRIEEYKRKKIITMNKKIQEDTKCMEKKLEGQEMAQRRQVEIKIKEEISKEITEDLEKTVSGISSAEQKGNDQIIDDEQELTNEKKEDQNKYQDILVQEVMDYEKQLNPRQCYAETNTRGAEIPKICPSFIQPGSTLNLEDVKECLDHTKFCKHCCNYNLGKERQVEIKDCNDQCERVVNPEQWLKDKAKRGDLTKEEQAELFQLEGSGFLVTVNKGNRIPGWQRDQKKK